MQIKVKRFSFRSHTT